MQRVMIIGQPGSGKSTLAHLLGERTGLPVLHMDRDVHWLPGWRERDRAEKLRILSEWHAKSHWIIEGGVSSTWPERSARADTLIFLDVGYTRRIWRLFLRAWRWRGRSRPDMAAGCEEQFGAEFREFMVYCWRTRKSARTLCLETLAAASANTMIVRLHSFSDVAGFVSSVPEA